MVLHRPAKICMLICCWRRGAKIDVLSPSIDPPLDIHEEILSLDDLLSECPAMSDFGSNAIE